MTLDGGGEAMLSPLPVGITQGATLTVEIVREAIPEAGPREAAPGQCLPNRAPPCPRPRPAGADRRIRASGADAARA